MDELDKELETAQRFATQAEHELHRCAAVALQHWRVNPPVVVEWSTRGLTAGYCEYPCRKHLSHYLLRFNAHMAAHEQDFDSTVAHEYAHAVCHFRHGGHHLVSPHGREWQLIMLVFGHVPHRCHTYASAQRARRG